MKTLDKLHAYLTGPGRAYIKPPVPRFVGIDDRLRVKKREKRKRTAANVVAIVEKGGKEGESRRVEKKKT